jgi:hypothetical protein
MRPHVVRQGEYLTRLASERGLDADEVWNHSANRELRERRPNRDILAPGDILRLPDPRPACAPIAAGGTRRYRASVPTVTVRVTLDSGRGPLAGERYEVHGVPGREPLRGSTGGDGVVAIELPVHVSHVDLHLPERGQILPLRVGHLDPPDEQSGRRSRLQHLGYLLPRPDELLHHPTLDDAAGPEGEPERLARAAAGFRRDRGLGDEPSTGETLDAALAERHGS